MTAKVSIVKGSAGFGLSVELYGNFPNLSKEEAVKLTEDAHQVCPYSKATRGNISAN